MANFEEKINVEVKRQKRVQKRWKYRKVIECYNLDLSIKAKAYLYIE